MNVFFPNGSISFPPRQGPDVHRYQIVRQLVARGHRVATLQPDQNPSSDVRPRGVHSLLKAIRRAGVIYVRADEGVGNAMRLTHPAIASVIPRRTAVVWEFNISPLLAVSHGQSAPTSRDLRSLAACGRRVDAYICVADGVAHDVATVLPSDRVHVVENASDAQAFYYQPGLKGSGDAALQVAWVGSHDNKLHDFDLLRQVAFQINSASLPIHLHLFGDNVARFDDCLSPRVQHHGSVPYAVLPRHLASIDVGLCLYRMRVDGGSPLKLFDYMASGCAVLASPGASAEKVSNVGGGCISRSWGADGLIEAMLRLRCNRHDLRVLQRDARSAVESTFNWDRVGDKIEDIISDAIAARAQ